MRRRAALILCSFLLLIFSASAAAEPVVEVNEKDEVIWANDWEQSEVNDATVNFEAYCSPETENGKKTSPDSIYVWNEVERIPMNEGSEGYFNKTGNSSYKFEVPLEDGELNDDKFEVGGAYHIFADCGGTIGPESSEYANDFYIDEIDFQLTNPRDEGKVYLGSSFTATAEVTSELDKLQLTKLGQDPAKNIIVEIDDENNNLQKIGEWSKPKQPRMSIKTQEIPIEFLTEGKNVDDRELKVSTEYRLKNSSNGASYVIPLEDSINVSLKRWDVQMNATPSRRIGLDQVSGLNLSVKMMRNGEPVTPPTADVDYAGNFFLERDDGGDPGSYEWFTGGFEEVTENGKYGRYNLRLNKIPADLSENLNIMFETDGQEAGDESGEPVGPIEVGTIYLNEGLKFEGRVSDSDSRAIDTTFRVDSGEYVEQFSTNFQGEFSRRIPDGNYGFDVQFPKGSISLESVEIKDTFSGNVNYDYFKEPRELDIDLPGIDPVNMMSVSFGYPFDQGRARMDFNPAKVEDPTDVKVFECVQFNFFGQECISGWEKIDEDDVQIRPTDWTARFPVTPAETDEYEDEKRVLYSAYVVGSNSGLRVSQIRLDDYRVAEGNNLKVSGTVMSGKGTVEGADVNVGLKADSIYFANSTSETGIDGEFTVNLKPERVGNYTFGVTADKGTYKSYSEEIKEKIVVYRETDVGLDVPGTLEISPGENRTEEITLNNGGDTDFENVELAVEVPEGFNHEISRSKFDSLESGKSRNIQLRLSIPKGHCDPSCSRYPRIEIKLTGESGGKSVQETFEIDTTVERPGGSESTTSSSETRDSEASSQGTGSPLSQVNAATGDFVNSQSGLNIALGLITVFTLALAGAIKKRKSSRNDNRRRPLRRPDISPGGSDEEVEVIAENVTSEEIDEKADSGGREVDEEWFDELDEPSDVKEIQITEDGVESHEVSKNDQEGVEEVADQIAEEENETDDEEDTEVSESSEESEQETDDSDEPETEVSTESYSCEKCGEEFETQSGLKLHKKAIHDEGEKAERE